MEKRTINLNVWRSQYMYPGGPTFELTYVDDHADTGITIDGVKYKTVDDIPDDVFWQSLSSSEPPMRTGTITFPDGTVL